MVSRNSPDWSQHKCNPWGQDIGEQDKCHLGEVVMLNNKAELDIERLCLSLQELSVQCCRTAPSSNSMVLNHPTKQLVDEIDRGDARLTIHCSIECVAAIASEIAPMRKPIAVAWPMRMYPAFP